MDALTRAFADSACSAKKSPLIPPPNVAAFMLGFSLALLHGISILVSARNLKRQAFVFVIAAVALVASLLSIAPFSLGKSEACHSIISNAALSIREFSQAPSDYSLCPASGAFLGFTCRALQKWFGREVFTSTEATAVSALAALLGLSLLIRWHVRLVTVLTLSFIAVLFATASSLPLLSWLSWQSVSSTWPVLLQAVFRADAAGVLAFLNAAPPVLLSAAWASGAPMVDEALQVVLFALTCGLALWQYQRCIAALQTLGLRAIRAGVQKSLIIYLVQSSTGLPLYSVWMLPIAWLLDSDMSTRTLYMAQRASDAWMRSVLSWLERELEEDEFGDAAEEYGEEEAGWWRRMRKENQVAAAVAAARKKEAAVPAVGLGAPLLWRRLRSVGAGSAAFLCLLGFLLSLRLLITPSGTGLAGLRAASAFEPLPAGNMTVCTRVPNVAARWAVYHEGGRPLPPAFIGSNALRMLDLATSAAKVLGTAVVDAAPAPLLPAAAHLVTATATAAMSMLLLPLSLMMTAVAAGLRATHVWLQDSVPPGNVAVQLESWTALLQVEDSRSGYWTSSAPPLPYDSFAVYPPWTLFHLGIAAAGVYLLALGPPPSGLFKDARGVAGVVRDVWAFLTASQPASTTSRGVFSEESSGDTVFMDLLLLIPALFSIPAAIFVTGVMVWPAVVALATGGRAGASAGASAGADTDAFAFLATTLPSPLVAVELLSLLTVLVVPRTHFIPVVRALVGYVHTVVGALLLALAADALPRQHSLSFRFSCENCANDTTAAVASSAVGALCTSLQSAPAAASATAASYAFAAALLCGCALKVLSCLDREAAQEEARTRAYRAAHAARMAKSSWDWVDTRQYQKAEDDDEVKVVQTKPAAAAAPALAPAPAATAPAPRARSGSIAGLDAEARPAAAPAPARTAAYATATAAAPAPAAAAAYATKVAAPLQQESQQQQAPAARVAPAPAPAPAPALGRQRAGSRAGGHSEDEAEEATGGWRAGTGAGAGAAATAPLSHSYGSGTSSYAGTLVTGGAGAGAGAGSAYGADRYQQVYGGSDYLGSRPTSGSGGSSSTAYYGLQAGSGYSSAASPAPAASIQPANTLRFRSSVGGSGAGGASAYYASSAYSSPAPAPAFIPASTGSTGGYSNPPAAYHYAPPPQQPHQQPPPPPFVPPQQRSPFWQQQQQQPPQQQSPEQYAAPFTGWVPAAHAHSAAAPYGGQPQQLPQQPPPHQPQPQQHQQVRSVPKVSPGTRFQRPAPSAVPYQPLSGQKRVAAEVFEGPGAPGVPVDPQHAGRYYEPYDEGDDHDQDQQLLQEEEEEEEEGEGMEAGAEEDEGAEVEEDVANWLSRAAGKRHRVA